MVTDLVIIIAIFAILLFITLQKGKRVVLSLIFGLYVAITVSKYLLFDPSIVNLSDTSFLIAFVAILIAAFHVISKYFKNYKADEGQGYIGGSLLSLSAVLLLLASYFHFLPETYYSFTPQVRDIFFQHEMALGVVFLLPIIAIFISSKDD